MHTSAAKELNVSCYHCRCMDALTSHSTAKHANASKPLFLPQDKLFSTGLVAQCEEHGVRLPHHDTSENCSMTLPDGKLETHSVDLSPLHATHRAAPVLRREASFCRESQ